MRIEAFAVVSDDDRITDAAGDMPDALRNDAEWAFFQAGLDAADVTVLGRSSHDVTPNPNRRRRLVLTSLGTRTGDDRTVFWTPEETSLEDALALFNVPIDSLAVAGGQHVFDHFLRVEPRFASIHLSRVEGVLLPGGRPVFGDVDRMGLSADEVLWRAGYQPGPRQRLDETAHVVTWRPYAT